MGTAICGRKDFNPPAPCGTGQAMVVTMQAMQKISIHPPHAGRDTYEAAKVEFPAYISIHPPHAGRDNGAPELLNPDLISIHPPHAGRDRGTSTTTSLWKNFNPPAPCGTGPGVGSGVGVISGFQSTRPMRDGT